jgi:hypothetical protein
MLGARTSRPQSARATGGSRPTGSNDAEPVLLLLSYLFRLHFSASRAERPPSGRATAPIGGTSILRRYLVLLQLPVRHLVSPRPQSLL